MPNETLPQKFNQAFADQPAETIRAAQFLDCNRIFYDGRCGAPCLNCGLNRRLLELYVPAEIPKEKNHHPRITQPVKDQ